MGANEDSTCNEFAIVMAQDALGVGIGVAHDSIEDRHIRFLNKRVSMLVIVSAGRKMVARRRRLFHLVATLN